MEYLLSSRRILIAGFSAFACLAFGASYVGLGLTNHWVLISAWTALFLGVFVSLYKEKFFNISSKMLGLGGSVVVGIFLTLLSYHCGMRQFGGFDHSALIDPAWRMICGQIPYRDFICTMPPVFYLGGALAFKLFGVYWSSLVLMCSLFGLIIFIWTIFLLKHLGMEWTETLLLSFFMQSCNTVLVSYWWYNPVTVLSAQIFFISAIVFIRKETNVFIQTSLVIALSLLSLSKPNIAFVVIFIVSCAIIIGSKARVRYCVLLFLSVCLSFFILFINNISVIDVIISYQQIAGRGFSLEQFLQDTSFAEKILYLAFVILGMYLLVTIFLKSLYYKSNFKWVDILISAAPIIAGVYGFVVNGENKIVDLSLIFFGICIIAFIQYGSKEKIFKAAFCSLMFMASLALGEGLQRHRVYVIGPGAFFEWRLVSEPFERGFFKGVYSGQRLHEVYDEVWQLTADNDKQQTLWFGPRMQWAYAAFKITPPEHQPCWWHPGVSYGITQEINLVSQWKEMKFRKLIFLGIDATYLPVSMLQHISKDYAIDSNSRETTCFKLVQ